MASTALTFLLLAASAASSSAASVPVPRQAGVVVNSCSRPGTLALAYDDGPYQYLSELVDLLDAADAKATFFVTGTLYGCIYDRAADVQKAYASGHQIASHTWTHPNPFDSLSESQLAGEMDRLDSALADIIGVAPLYMRAPYLQTGGSVLPFMAGRGVTVIGAGVDSGDWDGVSAEQSLQRFRDAGASGNGHISLLHETYQSTVTTLTSGLIDWAEQNGLELVTVADCLGDADGAYRTDVVGGGQNSC